jgi:hypothetical protein
LFRAVDLIELAQLIQRLSGPTVKEIPVMSVMRILSGCLIAAACLQHAILNTRLTMRLDDKKRLTRYEDLMYNARAMA